MYFGIIFSTCKQHNHST